MPALSHVEFLVEEPSAEAALGNLVPKLLGLDFTFNIYPHQGKHDLLQKLPTRLRGYRHWIPEDWGIVVLIDADGRNCLEQKTALEDMAQQAGFLTRARWQSGGFQVLNRLAIEELEAWFFGDVDALCEAYPGVSPTLGERAAYRDPDAIRGGTWEALERELQRAGYHRAGLAKIKAAREISARMEPYRNRSRSFGVFRQGLLDLVGI
ncbi:MAG TPA: DUF4276 family protein [Thermoanaerobaculia bacterium]|jgi:hypothetical protein